MDLSSPEALTRFSAFALAFVVLALAESWVPRRRRTLARRARWPGNLGLVALAAIAIRTMLPLTPVGAAMLAEAHGWGLLHAIDGVPVWLRIIAAVVLLDLAIYLQHVLFHAVPLLWRVHRVHHSDLELDVSSGVRFHPVEILVSAGFKLSVVAVIGPPIAAVVSYEILLNVGSLFSHANLRLSDTADRLLRRLVVTPDMHRVHHSIALGETNTNFGFTVSWWDHVFGTYRAQPDGGHEGMRIGVAGFDETRAVALHRLLLQPIENSKPSTRDLHLTEESHGRHQLEHPGPTLRQL